MSNLDDLTLGEIRELRSLFFGSTGDIKPFAYEYIGKHVIIRTYSAGVWFGVLDQKSGNEVILKNARRMWRWWAKESISLSAVALYGIKEDQSKIAGALDSIWLEAIEIIPTTDEATKSIKGAKDVEAE